MARQCVKLRPWSVRSEKLPFFFLIGLEKKGRATEKVTIMAVEHFLSRFGDQKQKSHMSHHHPCDHSYPHRINSTEDDEDVSRHFLTNGWAESGGGSGGGGGGGAGGGASLTVPLNEHELGNDKSRVRRATQV